jgi:D-alanyl-lipoteichoic acid acyltransferase DltB (MBOAT superfamily)
MPSIIYKRNRNNLEIVSKGKYLPNLKDIISIGITFCLTVFAWIFFRAENISHAMNYISHIFSYSLLSFPLVMPKMLFVLILVFIIIEWFGRENQYALEKFNLKIPRVIRWGFYYIIVFIIFYFAGSEQQFIYFQF